MLIINKMKVKRLLFVFLIAIICLFTFGCHGKKVDQNKENEENKVNDFIVPSQFDTSKNFELSFWAKNDSNIYQKNIYKKAIEDFQKLYPNIKINIKHYSDYGTIYNDVITNISTNSTPNICISYPDHVATYLKGNNIVVPLDNLIDDENYGLGGSNVNFDSVEKEEMVDEFLEECNFKDHYYTMPFMRSTEACYVNVDYVKRLGFTLPDVLTWDFIFEVSEKAMELKEKDQVLIPIVYKSTDNMMIQMLKQKGYSYSTDDGEIDLFNENTKSILKYIAPHAENREISTFKISSYPGNFFNAGQCIFAIDSTAGSTWMGSKAPLMDIPEEDVVQFETEVMTVPQFDTNNLQMISQGPSMCIFNKEDPQEVLASWLFMQYLLTNDVQSAYSQTEGYAPVTKKVQNSLEYKEYLANIGKVTTDNTLYYDVKIKATKLLLNNIQNTFTTPVFDGSASLRDAAGQLIEDTIKSIRRKQDVNEKFYNELFINVSSLYRLNRLDEFNGLSSEAIILLSTIGFVWVLIGSYVGYNYYKHKKEEKKKIID